MVPLFIQVIMTLINLLAGHIVSVSGRPPVNSGSGSIACSPKASDIVFALDSSYSIRSDEFKLQLGFLQAIVDQLPYGPDRFLVGVISFGSEVKLELDLSYFESKWDLKKAISGIKHLESGTNTWKAINFARNKLFDPEFGARPSARKQLVIVTDGISENVTATITEAGIAKSQGIEIFSIAISQEPNGLWEIASIASEPKKRHTFKVTNFQALASIVSSVSEKACNNFYGDQPSSGQVEIVKQKPLPLKKKSSVITACKGTEAEVLFLLDSSTSVWDLDFKKSVAFIKEVTESFDIANGKTRVGVVVYSDGSYTHINLAELQSPEHILEVLSKAPYLTGGTNTGAALRHARTKEFSKARPYVARIIVLLTDGRSRNQRGMLKEAKKARKSGIGLFIVGVGQSAKTEHLRAISSDPNSENFVFHTRHSHKKFTVPRLFAEKACKEAASLKKSPPPEKCPSSSTDIIFVYDSSALSRQHNNQVIRTIMAVTSSRRLNSGGALRVGVIRDVQKNSATSAPVASDIGLTENWTGRSNFRRRLDPKSRRAAVTGLLKNVRLNYFKSDMWGLPEDQGRRRLVVLFLDSPVVQEITTNIEADSLKKSSDVEIVVVALGRNFNQREARKIASSPAHKHIIRSKRKGKSPSVKIEDALIKSICR